MKKIQESVTKMMDPKRPANVMINKQGRLLDSKGQAVRLIVPMERPEKDELVAELKKDLKPVI